MDRRQALKWLAAVGATGLASACSTDGATGPSRTTNETPVTIGLLVPQTGAYKPIGDEIINGFQLWLDLNDRRLGGHPAIVTIGDEGESVATGKASATKLLDQGVLALSGVVNSNVMVAIKDAVEQARVPLIGSNASPLELQGVVYNWRTSFVNDEAGKALGAYLTRQEDIGRVAMIGADTVAGQETMTGFKNAFGSTDADLAPDVIWTPDNPKPDSGFFDSHLQRLAQLDPKTVFAYYVGPAAAQFVKQFRAAKLSATLYSPGFLTEGAVLGDLEQDAKGVYTALNYSADLNNPANRRFAAAYRREHDASPTTYAMASFDAAQVLDKAIRLTGGEPTSLEVNRMLSKIGQIDSPRGAWQFNQSRTPQQKWYLRQVRQDGTIWSNVLISELGTLG